MEKYFKNMIRKVKTFKVLKTLKVVQRQAKTKLNKILNSDVSESIKKNAEKLFSELSSEISAKELQLTRK